MKWIRNFMYGRYGVDNLGNFLMSMYFVCFFLSFFISEFRYLSYVFFFYCFYRMLSKQYAKRRQENAFYLEKTKGIRKTLNRYKNQFVYRKTHRYFKCPHCHQYLRVPKGKGTITVTCPKCHQQFDKRT